MEHKYTELFMNDTPWDMKHWDHLVTALPIHSGEVDNFIRIEGNRFTLDLFARWNTCGQSSFKTLERALYALHLTLTFEQLALSVLYRWVTINLIWNGLTSNCETASSSPLSFSSLSLPLAIFLDCVNFADWIIPFAMSRSMDWRLNSKTYI